MIHDVKARAYGGWGIYPDEGSSEIVIEDNLAYRCNSAPFFAHINRDITVRNNIFAFGEGCQVERAGAHPGPEREYAFQRNIVNYLQGQLVGYWDSRNRNFTYEKNLYWNASGAPVTFDRKSFAEWQAAGLDKDSLIADPLFVDPERGDFRLRPGSPAAKIGFEPWDLSAAGPRPTGAGKKSVMVFPGPVWQPPAELGLQMSGIAGAERRASVDGGVHGERGEGAEGPAGCGVPGEHEGQVGIRRPEGAEDLRIELPGNPVGRAVLHEIAAVERHAVLPGDHHRQPHRPPGRVRPDDDIRPPLHQQGSVVDRLPGIPAAVLPLGPGVQEVPERTVVLRAAVGVGGGDGDVVGRDAGPLRRLPAREVGEFPRDGAEVVSDEGQGDVALGQHHGFREERIVHAGADELGEAPGAAPAHRRGNLHRGEPRHVSFRRGEGHVPAGAAGQDQEQHRETEAEGDEVHRGTIVQSSRVGSAKRGSATTDIRS